MVDFTSLMVALGLQAQLRMRSEPLSTQVNSKASSTPACNNSSSFCNFQSNRGTRPFVVLYVCPLPSLQYSVHKRNNEGRHRYLSIARRDNIYKIKNTRPPSSAKTPPLHTA